MCREAPDELLDARAPRRDLPPQRGGQARQARLRRGVSAARTYYVADITGQAILHVLYEQLMKYDEVYRYEEWFTTALVQDDDGRIAGAITRNIRDGSLELFAAKAVILATGGNGQIYDPTTNALICTGDGIAMAYRIGAPLMDMEMIQYHPTTLAGLGLLITEGARGEGAHLYNAEGERFMEKYAPNKMELASRDVVSRAEQTEIDEGRGFPDGTVALDITVVPRKRIHEALREIVNVGPRLRRRGHHARADPHQAGQPLRDGRRQDRHLRPDARSPASTRPASAPASRCTAATGSAPTRCSTRSCSAAAPARTPPRPSRACRVPEPTLAQLADEEERIARDRRPRRQRPARVGDQGRARRDDGQARGRLPRRGRAARRLETVRRLQEEAKDVAIDDKGTVFNQDVLGALELQFMLDNAEASWSRRSSARRAAAPSSAPTSPSATTTSGSSTSTSRRTATSPRSPTRRSP